MGNPIASTTSGSAQCAKAQERISGAAPGDSRGVYFRTATASFSAPALSWYLFLPGSTRCSSAPRMSLHATARSVTAQGSSPRRIAVSNRARHALVVKWVHFPPHRDAAHGCLPLRFHGRRDNAAVAPDAFRRTPASMASHGCLSSHTSASNVARRKPRHDCDTRKIPPAALAAPGVAPPVTTTF